jgi:D-glycero-alpha-D-manno-heptose-7-phosphate kinase
MIISRTPFRVSFIGGGTDLPAFYNREQGAVISTTVNKYVFLTVNRRFDQTLRVSYSKTEIVDKVENIHHPLFRETMRFTGADCGLEATSIADIPSGMGLGSSSSFTVGLLHALQAFQGRYKTAGELAKEACHLEMDILGEPIGKQDQYAAAFGGLRRYRFNSDGSVFVDPVICPAETKAALFGHLLFFYLGGSRNARQVLEQQSRNTDHNIEPLRKIRRLTDEFWEALVGNGRMVVLGELLHQAWLAKKQLATNISNERIDEYYARARAAGALGGKVLGAGMGGFLLLFCEPPRQPAVRESLRELREIQFGLEPEGSKIIYVGGYDVP